MTTPWYWDRDQIQAAVEKHGSLNAAARALGGSSTQVKVWWLRHGLPPRPNRNVHGVSSVPPVAASGLDEPAWLLAALKKLGDAASVEQIADHADVSPRRVREALAVAGESGYRVAEDAGRVVIDRMPPAPRGAITPILFDGERYRFAVVSDTHLGSNEQRLDELHAAYDKINSEGITDVYHPGDLVCGKGIYRTQVRDVFLHTFDAQVAYAVENYPRAAGVTTRIIAGNHDLEGDFGRDGADPVRAVANQRDDLVYLGEYDAWCELPNGAHIHMLHPGGGSSYALSYKPQKLCEAYEAGRKPAVLLLGHYHRHGYFEARSINVFMCGTFEGSTNLAKRYGMGKPSNGFWLVDLRIAEDASVVDVGMRWLPLYTGRRVAA